MKRVDGIIELTRDEIEYLWCKAYGAEFPEVLSLRTAAEAVLLMYGAEMIERELNERSVCDSMGV